MKIDVTQEDIDKSLEEMKREGCISSTTCPIARASQRALDMYCGFDGDNLTIFRTGQEIFIGDEAVRFARIFDLEMPVTPFSFELNM